MRKADCHPLSIGRDLVKMFGRNDFQVCSHHQHCQIQSPEVEKGREREREREEGREGGREEGEKRGRKEKEKREGREREERGKEEGEREVYI